MAGKTLNNKMLPSSKARYQLRILLGIEEQGWSTGDEKGV
jgi:hypothetical protein